MMRAALVRNNGSQREKLAAARRMLRSCRSAFARLRRSAAGSFTLEASLILPTILIASVLLLFIALFVYHQASLYQSASLTAERSAFVWDNSAKDHATGYVEPGRHDPLYWRLTNDNALHLFSFLLPIDPVRVALPAAAGGGSSAPADKLSQAAARLPSSWKGELRFSNRGLIRDIEVYLARPFHSPAYRMNRWGADEVRSDAAAVVVDPVETARLTDLTRSFIGEVKDRIRPSAAKQLMKEPQSVPKERTVISSHNEAARYLRGLVGGTAQKVEVKPGTVREIDALDANGIAHQAFYTFTEKQLREVQLPKDAELLRSGAKISGVVWHFFETKKGRVKLSAAFRNELARSGIVVVIHNR